MPLFQITDALRLTLHLDVAGIRSEPFNDDRAESHLAGIVIRIGYPVTPDGLGEDAQHMRHRQVAKRLYRLRPRSLPGLAAKSAVEANRLAWILRNHPRAVFWHNPISRTCPWLIGGRIACSLHVLAGVKSQEVEQTVSRFRRRRRTPQKRSDTRR